MNSKNWDAFISHASEDKDLVARPLATMLEKHGVKIWYDETTLTLGDSLRRSIDHGLGKSRYGIVILSPNFFSKEWTQKELDALVGLESDGHKVILPIWYNISKERVSDFSPLLADKLAVLWSRGIDHVVSELLRVINGGQSKKEFQNKYDAFNPPTAVDRGKLGITIDELRELPRNARLALAFRCCRRLESPLFANWAHGSLWDTVGFINKELMPRIDFYIQFPEESGQKMFYFDAKERLTTEKSTAYDSFMRMRAPHLAIECLNAHVMMVEFALGNENKLEEMVYLTCEIFGALNPDNTIIKEELRRDFTCLSSIAKKQKWSDQSPIGEGILGNLWLDNEPKYFNPTQDRPKTFFDHLKDIVS